jgi:hypothetical protein
MASFFCVGKQIPKAILKLNTSLLGGTTEVNLVL